MPEGYCTVEDVRRALQETGFDGALEESNNQVVVDAIAGQAEWLRTTTDRHWYEPDGIEEDDHDLVPTEARSRDDEEHDIPSTPHPQHSQVFIKRRERYPRRLNGPFTRVKLDKHYADEVTALKVRDASGGYEDWIAEGKVEDEDWALYVEPGSTSSPSYVDLHVAELPAMNHYDKAVRVSYTYGLEGLSDTIRRAVAFKAASELVLDDEAVTAISDSGQLVNVETKANAMERKAMDLLEPYL